MVVIRRGGGTRVKRRVSFLRRQRGFLRLLHRHPQRLAQLALLFSRELLRASLRHAQQLVVRVVLRQSR